MDPDFFVQNTLSAHIQIIPLQFHWCVQSILADPSSCIYTHEINKIAVTAIFNHLYSEVENSIAFWPAITRHCTVPNTSCRKGCGAQNHLTRTGCSRGPNKMKSCHDSSIKGNSIKKYITLCDFSLSFSKRD